MSGAGEAAWRAQWASSPPPVESPTDPQPVAWRVDPPGGQSRYYYEHLDQAESDARYLDARKKDSEAACMIEPLVPQSALTEVQAENERLRQWKAEALPVMSGLQDLGKALGLPLGMRITSTFAAEKAERLVSELVEARAALVEADRRTQAALVLVDDLIEIQSLVEMDTDEDRALNAQVVETYRARRAALEGTS